MTRVWRGLGPDSGFRFGYFPEFGFGSVSAFRVRIRIGSASAGSDSDRIRLRRFGFGSDTGSVRILHPNPGLGTDAARFSLLR